MTFINIAGGLDNWCDRQTDRQTFNAADL